MKHEILPFFSNVSLQTSNVVPIPCSHCALPVPPGLIEPGAEVQFCCAGCRTVYAAIQAGGLEVFYRVRAATGQPGWKPDIEDSHQQALDDPRFLQRHATTHGDGSMSCRLLLDGVHCAACVWLVERLPKLVPGVLESRLSLAHSTVQLSWNPQQTSLTEAAAGLRRIGYSPRALNDTTGQDPAGRQLLIRLAVAGALAGNVMLAQIALYLGDMDQAQGGGDLAPNHRLLLTAMVTLLGSISLFWPGLGFFRGAIGALRVRRPHMDQPIALALLIGAIGGWISLLALAQGRGSGETFFDSLSMLVFLLLVGRFLRHRQQRKASEKLALLTSLTPAAARKVIPTENGERLSQEPAGNPGAR